MKTLYVVAHAEAQHHLDGLVGGWYDSELTPLGHGQAARVAARLRAVIPPNAQVELYSSDLKRAAQTADAIAARLDVPVQATRDLREISYGEAEGRPQAWLDERFVHAPRVGNRMDHDYGIPGAETKRQAGTRIYRAMARILAEPCPYQVIVTHGFAVTLVVAAWLRLPLDAAGSMSIKASPGSIAHLVEDDEFHNRGLVTINETAHLT